MCELVAVPRDIDRQQREVQECTKWHTRCWLAAIFGMLQPECSYEDTKRSIPEVFKRLDDSHD